jgi:hypothetical protein
MEKQFNYLIRKTITQEIFTVTICATWSYEAYRKLQEYMYRNDLYGIVEKIIINDGKTVKTIKV